MDHKLYVILQYGAFTYPIVIEILLLKCNTRIFLPFKIIFLIENYRFASLVVSTRRAWWFGAFRPHVKSRVRSDKIHFRGIKTAKISEDNVRCRQLFCLQGYFASRSQPFWRPKDLSHIVHCRVGKARLRITKSTLCRLALNNMASNLEGGFNRS